jgi:CheY-like chemotaxis protein
MTSKLKLVVVEDSETDAELIERCLVKAGLDVVIHRVQNESDFISALHSVNPDLILSDFCMPLFNGLRALEVAVRHAPETPFMSRERSARKGPSMRCNGVRPIMF